MSVLVTGAAGFIGSHVVDRLLRRGESVLGLDDFDPFYPRRTKLRNLSRARKSDAFRLVEGDIRDRTLLAGLPDEVDAVVHLAAKAGVRPSIEDPAGYTSVNVQGTVALLEMVREREIRPFLFASSSSVYGNNEKVPFSEDDPVDRPISPYAATKKAGELICHTYHHLYGVDVVCLRFFTAYGPRQRPDLAIHKFARLLAAGEPIPMYGDGTSRRDYTYIDDIVDGVEAALELARRGGVYEVINLGESRTVALSEMIEVLASELGVEPRIDALPMQPGDVQRTYADVSKARRLLGYEPSSEFAVGIRRFLEWFETRG
ncbi:MAG: GDP-mannose 4,6-dehydratase [Gemmatimonadota bacterium]